MNKQAAPTPKELLTINFAVPEDLILVITDAEAEAAHADLTAARGRGETPDGPTMIALLIAARNALESQVIYTKK